mmetsp:Transcript_13311/g.31487  ORF Transcript_13311/g.31487 Transcript_13311/m.31487 type:complete len:203 (+) Transcript_13311:504-1112(+)
MRGGANKAPPLPASANLFELGHVRSDDGSAKELETRDPRHIGTVRVLNEYRKGVEPLKFDGVKLGHRIRCEVGRSELELLGWLQLLAILETQVQAVRKQFHGQGGIFVKRSDKADGLDIHGVPEGYLHDKLLVRVGLEKEPFVPNEQVRHGMGRVLVQAKALPLVDNLGQIRGCGDCRLSSRGRRCAASGPRYGRHRSFASE